MAFGPNPSASSQVLQTFLALIIRTMDDILNGLSDSAQARVRDLTQKHWSTPGEHPLSKLHGLRLGDYFTAILLGPKSSVGSQSFLLLLASQRGNLADVPLAVGLHNQGPYPAFNWIELTRYDAELAVAGSEVDLALEGYDLRLFQALSQFAPAGGHIMVEYDSPSQRQTARILTLGYPEVTSPTGYLMFQVGCRSFKNWHISEGGREGPRKLQGFIPWNDEIRTEKTTRLHAQIARFLERGPDPKHGERGETARANAMSVVQALEAEP